MSEREAVKGAMTLYLTNATSRRPPQRGPGRVLTIMAAPRPAFGEAGEGVVTMLVPQLSWVRAAKAGELATEAYRELYVGLLAERAHRFAPGRLTVTLFGAGIPTMTFVEGDDTLICACSRAAAAEGRCHRVWAADALLAAGWDVVLDGVALVRPVAP